MGLDILKVEMGFQNHQLPELVTSQLALSHFSHVQLSATLWTVARQAPPSMGFSRQEYWNGSPFPSPGDLPNPRSEHLASSALAGGFFSTSTTWEAPGAHAVKQLSLCTTTNEPVL